MFGSWRKRRVEKEKKIAKRKFMWTGKSQFYEVENVETVTSISLIQVSSAHAILCFLTLVPPFYRSTHTQQAKRQLSDNFMLQTYISTKHTHILQTSWKFDELFAFRIDVCVHVHLCRTNSTSDMNNKHLLILVAKRWFAN